MAGPLKTEGVVLRSLRYGEADRILHVFTPHRGKLGAIAKGVRRSRSRFGGRLEPFFRVELMLHEGRSDLLVADDGVGGAGMNGGTGLAGLADRVAAQGGTLVIDSPPGAGTTIAAEFPCVS